jgi:hypothetical protein
VVYYQYHYCIPIPRWWNSFCTEQSKAETFFKVVNKLWVLDAGSTKALHASFFSLSALGPIYLFLKKDGWCTHTVWVLYFWVHVLGWQRALCTHYKAHIVHNKIQKCIWATPTCFWAPPNTSWTCKWTIRKKYKQASIVLRTLAYLMSSEILVPFLSHIRADPHRGLQTSWSSIL